MRKILLSILVITVILFLWSGMTQLFPWGVPSTQNVATQSPGQEKFESDRVLELPAQSLTTSAYDSLFAGKISTLTTDDTFSWIVNRPIETYDMTGYFVKEIITQALVALLLSILLFLTQPLPFGRRMAIIVFASLAAVTAIYGQLMNWWGLPNVYALGVSFNLIIGWTIAAYVSAKWIIKKPAHPAVPA
ncbi:hypothetical protein KI659_12005 [Litoribacter alkaliphilus]|uniref:Uncharacterized protein n=1 Tax=Litoribacter ruber TaxID=702568 RepID=A0AAP2CHD4_9BACT|nr:hypothetical protein [Litoribacter alkaliphilus]MBS9524733.1 hypothetical protein [Litoribacter alkaliphilus]